MIKEEKADKWVKHNCCEVCVNKEECDLGYINCFAKLAYLAGLKAGKLQWHKVYDGDLPDGERVVLNQKGMATLYNPYTGFDEIGVIAWCEIPQYTEEETMTEEEKFYVHKYSGHYYTENRIPASGKVLFEGTEKECYEFVKKEMEILPYEERDFCNGCFPIVCREVYNKANDGMTVKEIRERVRKIIGDNKE